MEFAWIPIAMAAGLFQAVRTAAQKRLNAELSTWMTTYVRSIYGLPVMLVYLWVVMSWEDLGVPALPREFLFHCLMTAIAQVAGTYLLILLFQRANFAVGTMLTKTDVMMAAIIGSLLFSEVISLTGWIAILLTVIGVVLISAGRTRQALVSRGWRDWVAAPSTLIGLASGFSFCLSYLFLREASLVLEQGTPVYRAAWSMVTVTTMQCVFLGIWLVVTERAEFSKLGRVARPAAFIGLTSALGSIGWFTAMAMQNASYVKAVGQVEVIFTILISTLYFRERISWIEYTGIATIVAGVLMFLV